MKKSDDKRQMKAKQQFERAMADSTELFQDLIDDVEFGIEPDNFLLQELGHLIQDGEPSFENDAFHFVIRQGIRLYVNPSVDLRARLAESLRRAYPDIKGPARRVANTVIGAIEDSDFSLDVVGAVVRGYTNRLLGALESQTDNDTTDPEGRLWIEQWTEGKLDRLTLLERFRDLGSAGVPAVADLLFDSLEDPLRVQTALELLAAIRTPVAARLLAYIVSEPILEEHQEEHARKTLRELWEPALPYVLYNLRRHVHEDIPFRWLELLIETDNTRGVDRILEELVAHARSTSYREDLLAALPLLDRSNDPGVVGKLLRLITEESLPEEALELIEHWMEGSSLAGEVEAALERLRNGKTILVLQRDDFNSFTAEQPEISLAQLLEDWNAAYHESLGWQQKSQFPRGPIESQSERELEEAMLERLALNPRLEESVLRDQIESFRESWLVKPKDNVIPLASIWLERQRNTPWLDELYWNEINTWYIKGSQYLDEGDTDKARHYLDIILKIEPAYPLALMLDRIMSGGG